MSKPVNSASDRLLSRLGWSASRKSWEERIGVALLLLAAGLAIWLGRGAPLTEQVLIWGLLLLVLAAVLRRGWLKLFGPVLFYELVQIARRKRYFVLRTLYACLLLFLLCWLFLVWLIDSRSGGIRATEMTKFSESFFYLFMTVQFLLVGILTPAYTAGSIAEEKDRKTLEFLLATDLRNREIVLGKLAARLANIFLLILTGLPILSLLQVIGGIDPNLVLAGFAASLLTMASLGGLSILNSVLMKRPRDAIISTYLMACGYLMLSGLSWLLLLHPSVANFPSMESWASPITVDDLVRFFNAGNLIAAFYQLAFAVARGGRLEQVLPALLRDYAIFHGLVAIGCCTWAVLRLRSIALQQSQGKPNKLAVRTRFWRRPEIGQNPMIWKELFAEPGYRFNWLGRILIILIVIGSFLPGAFVVGYFLDRIFHFTRGGYGSDDPLLALSEGMNIWARSIGAMVACLTLLSVAVRASSTVSSERDRQTLDALLTSPLGSSQILFAKWLGSVLSVRLGWLWLGLIWMAAAIAGGLHPLALMLLVIAWFVYAAALSGLGLWFSVVSRTTLRATIWTLFTTAGIGVGHWIVWMCCIPFFRIAAPGRDSLFEWLAKLQAGITPPVALSWLLPFRGQDFIVSGYQRKDEWELFCGIIGICFWGVIAFVLWSAAVGQFQVVTGRRGFRRHPPSTSSDSS